MLSLRFPGRPAVAVVDAHVYIVDVDGQRQVFFTRTRSATSSEDRRELQAVLDSIRIET